MHHDKGRALAALVVLAHADVLVERIVPPRKRPLQQMRSVSSSAADVNGSLSLVHHDKGRALAAQVVLAHADVLVERAVPPRQRPLQQISSVSSSAADVDVPLRLVHHNQGGALAALVVLAHADVLVERVVPPRQRSLQPDARCAADHHQVTTLQVGQAGDKLVHIVLTQLDHFQPESLETCKFGS